MPEQGPEKFSFRKRMQSFKHAFRGIGLLLGGTHNAWIHSVILAVMLIAGAYFQLSAVGWVLLVLAAGLVFTAEAFNSAIEVDINLTSPEYHPYARDTKDIAAGAVLIACFTAAVVGMLIFVPLIIGRL